ncbi:MAG: M16 family metallopeptidase [Acidobacteriota bacterium]
MKESIRPMCRPALLLAVMLLTLQTAAMAASTGPQVAVDTFKLENGMTFLLVRKPEMSTVSAAWVAHVGSSNERPGITGISHLFEHMMFKGTRTVGTTDIDRDLQIIQEQETLQDQIRRILVTQRRRARLGEIDDPFDPDVRPDDLIDLEHRFEKLVEEQRSIMKKDEFDKIYTEAGGSGMNAFTTQDMTGYFITVPANKTELWFWMESDRLLHPVFREFYSERDVVYEERRLRTESSPTGEFDELFEAMFWESHPYSWPVVGWPSDLEVITKRQADDYFRLYYSPGNITAILVGNLDPQEVRTLARRYFGRGEASERPIPDVVTLEMPQRAEKRMNAQCDCQDQIRIAYHTVAFRHRDSYALDVLAGLLNGRTGRLYKSMVLGDQIASSASASQDSRKWGGMFEFQAEAKGQSTPDQLEKAWFAQLKKIVDEPIPAKEMEKVKNGISADAYRRLQNPFFLMLQLMFYDGNGDWRYINYNSQRTLSVTADDVKRVARTYLTRERRAVGQYRRKAGTREAALVPELKGLPDQMRKMMEGQIRQIRRSTDAEKLRQALQAMEQQAGNVPPPMQKVIPVLKKIIRERLEELGKEQSAAGEGGAR